MTIKAYGAQRCAAQVVMIAFLIFDLVGCYAIKTSQYENDAMPLTNQFLNLLDAGSYHEAYSTSGVSFKNDESKFVSWFTNHRTPMGGVVRRTFTRSLHMTEFPSEPDGDYLEMRFKTEFENKKNGWEGVILKRSGENWKVIHYFIN